MSLVKIKGPCPRCGEDILDLITYETATGARGSRCVECFGCLYRGPIMGNLKAAVIAHNAGYDAALIAGAKWRAETAKDEARRAAPLFGWEDDGGAVLDGPPDWREFLPAVPF